MWMADMCGAWTTAHPIKWGIQQIFLFIGYPTWVLFGYLVLFFCFCFKILFFGIEIEKEEIKETSFIFFPLKNRSFETYF